MQRKSCTDKCDQQRLRSLRLRDPSSSSSNERAHDTTTSEQSQQQSAIVSAVIQFIPVSSPFHTHAQSLNIPKPAVEFSPCVCVRHRHRRPHESTFGAFHHGREPQYGNRKRPEWSYCCSPCGGALHHRPTGFETPVCTAPIYPMRRCKTIIARGATGTSRRIMMAAVTSREAAGTRPRSSKLCEAQKQGSKAKGTFHSREHAMSSPRGARSSNLHRPGHALKPFLRASGFHRKSLRRRPPSSSSPSSMRCSCIQKNKKLHRQM